MFRLISFLTQNQSFSFFGSVGFFCVGVLPEPRVEHATLNYALGISCRGMVSNHLS